MQRSVPRSDLEPGGPVAHPGAAIAVAGREPVPVRIGVLGCSSIARRRMLPAMAADPSVGVVAIASRNPAAAAEVAGGYGCAAVTGYQALLERSDVEAVYAPLPLALHEEWADACLAAGKHLLLEKPMTADPAVTRRLLRRAERAGLVLMENVMFVQHRQHDAVRRLVADGLIGELRSLRAVFTIPALPDQDIRYQPELGGGALWDVGVYPVRTALELLGPELAVAGAILTTGVDRRVHTGGVALLRRPDGLVAQLEFGLEHAYTCRYELLGSTGSLLLDRAFTPPADWVPELVVQPAGRRIRLAADDQVVNSVAAFAAAVRTGRTPPAAAAASVAQIDLLDELYRAAGAGRSMTGPGR